MEPDAVQQRQKAHMLLDAVPDSKIPEVHTLLETMVDPLSRSFANASQDGAINDEMARGLAAGCALLASREGIPHEDIPTKYGLTAEDWERMGVTRLPTGTHKPDE